MAFVNSGTGLVSKCRIPVGAVVDRGLFRIVLGSQVTEIISKASDYTMIDGFYWR